MKRDKLKLKELQVDSFITQIKKTEEKTVEGGTIIAPILLSITLKREVDKIWKIVHSEDCPVRVTWLERCTYGVCNTDEGRTNCASGVSD